MRAPSLAASVHKVEFAIVPDNTVLGAYDEAIRGVDYVIHIAGVWPRPVSGKFGVVLGGVVIDTNVHSRTTIQIMRYTTLLSSQWRTSSLQQRSLAP